MSNRNLSKLDAIRTAARAAVLAIACACGLGMSTASAQGAQETEAAWWQVDSRSAPRFLPQVGGEGQIEALATDLGAAGVRGTSTNPVKLIDMVPTGLKVTKVGAAAGVSSDLLPAPTCSVEPAPGAPTKVECTFEGTLEPYERIEVRIGVKTENAEGGKVNHATVSGGEAVGGQALAGTPAPASDSAAVEATGEATPFGVERYELRPEEANGETDTSAGSHPFQMTTTLDLDQTFEVLPGSSEKKPGVRYQARNLSFVLPPGLLGNTTALPQCPDGDFSTLLEKNTNLCKADTAIGVAVVTINEPDVEPGAIEDVPVFNLVPAEGEPARLGFEVDRVPVYLDTEVLSGSNYAVRVTAHDTSRTAQLLRSVVTVWGAPGAAVHDSARGWACVARGSHAREHEKCETPSGLGSAPYLRMPTQCSQELRSELTGESWPLGQGTQGVPLVPPPAGELSMGFLQGCEKLLFEPSITVAPVEKTTNTPTGLDVTVTVPQTEHEGLIQSNIRENTVVLPQELQASAAAANGLETCSASQLGFKGLEKGLPEEAQLDNDEFSPKVPECPAAAKIGTVNIRTPLLPEEFVGSVFMAEQNADPFRSPLGLYIVAQAPVSKVLVELAGAINIGANGQLETTFKNTPDTPVESLELHLFNGARASQATPAFCGTYQTTGTFKSWSEKSTPVASSFEINENCPSGPLPFSPSFQAEATNLQAGAFTPFTMTIKKADGQQALEKIKLETPPGMAALIGSVPLCPNPQTIPLEIAPGPHGEDPAPPCPADSQIGVTTGVSGLGGDPVTLPGKLYLTEGYGGAPFGLLAVTEAKAGPFDLGLVNVRSQIFVNKETTAATIVSEPIPKIVQGVPSQLKQLNVTVNRSGFEFNPTSCERMKVEGKLAGSTIGGEHAEEHAEVGVSSNFQVANCASLPFEPKLTATVAGQGSKENGTTFTVTVESPGLGQANIHKVDLTIPALLPSRLTTIQKACLQATFEANPASCAEGSVIGEGVVETPVFKHPLRGPAYLVSHGAAAFPDVEFVLQGEGEAKGIEVILDGKTDIKNKVTYSRFETSPDAPFTKFVSTFPAGPHSALTPNVPENEHYNLCKHTLTLPTEITGQNGAFISQTTPVAILGCSGVKPSKVTKLSRAQLLAKALKACKKDKKKSKRVACEKAAHKKYGPHKAAKKHAKHKK